MPGRRTLPAALLGAALLGATAAAEWSGFVAVEARGFFHAPLDPDQHGANLSLAAEPEFTHRWDDGRHSFRFVPFLRWDQHDDARSHADIRELGWVVAAQAWELRAGVRKVFWGVTESQHLVDVINQTDLVENLDGEDKLGQPMINLALIHDWGTVDLYALAGFRERSFPGREGRLRSHPPVDTGLSQFESSRGRGRIDAAIRWRRSIGAFDIGLAHFHGTARDPRLVPGLDDLGRPVLIPHYDIIDQSSLDLQATLGQWLWKLETISRRQQGERFTAATAGFEYTLVGVLAGSADLGLLAEYVYDDRGTRAPTPFQDDLFLGLRLALNDVQSTELLAGVIGDREFDTRFYNLEASRRIGDHWKIALELRALSGAPAADPFFSLRRDDTLQIELARYF
ncbi:MAG TPA: hypothetical protein VGA00_02490 [Acidiferrobacterales bacterium]